MGKGRNTHDVMVKRGCSVVPNGERRRVPKCDVRQTVTDAASSEGSLAGPLVRELGTTWAEDLESRAGMTAAVELTPRTKAGN